MEFLKVYHQGWGSCKGVHSYELLVQGFGYVWRLTYMLEEIFHPSWVFLQGKDELQVHL